MSYFLLKLQQKSISDGFEHIYAQNQSVLVSNRSQGQSGVFVSLQGLQASSGRLMRKQSQIFAAEGTFSATHQNILLGSASLNSASLGSASLSFASLAMT